MGIVVTDLGISDSTASTTVLSVPVSVPVGAVIVVGIVEKQTSSYGTGSVVDSKGNTYTSIAALLNDNTAGSNSFGQLFYAKVTVALTSSDTITYNHVGTLGAGVTALAATGCDSSNPLDTSVTATAYGNSSSPSITSGAPSVAGELMVACVTLNASTTFGQSSGGWSSPLDYTDDGGSACSVAGGHLINSGMSAVIYNPSFSSSHDWASFIIGLKPSTLLSIGPKRIVYHRR